MTTTKPKPNLFVDELTKSNILNFHTDREFKTYIDGSSITGEQYLRTHIRVGYYGCRKINLSRLIRRSFPDVGLGLDELTGSRWEWVTTGGDRLYVEEDLPERWRKGPSGVGEDYEDFLRWIERDGASFNSDLEGSYLELRIEYSQLHDKLFTIWSLHRFRLSRWESNF